MKINRIALAIGGLLLAGSVLAADLTAERNTPSRELTRITVGVYTNTRIFAGSLVSINSSGYAIPSTTGASETVVGRASETVDNRTGASGAGPSGTFTIDVDMGVFGWANSASAVTDANIGEIAYVKDNQTVDATGSGAYCIAGVIVDVDGSYVWVDTHNFAAAGSSTPATLAVTGAGTIGTTLGVGGAATLDSSLAVAGNSRLTGTLNVNGATTVSNSITGDGFSMSDAGALSMDSNLRVTGTANVNGAVTVSNSVTGDNFSIADAGSAYFKGGMIIGSDLTASNATTLGTTTSAVMKVTGACTVNQMTNAAGAYFGGTDYIKIGSLPTAVAGTPSGALWNSNNVICIVP